MQLLINPTDALPIHLQLSEQLKYHIEVGTWHPGARLPNVRELAASLRLNYHTVRTTYQELERQGYIRTEQGRGSFVALHPPLLPTSESTALLDLIDDALFKAQAMGVSAETFIRTASTRARLLPPQLADIRLLFIECNQPDVQHHAQTIEQALGIHPETMLLAELHHADPHLLQSFDLITTPLFHIAEVQEVLRPNRTALGLLVTPSSTTILADLARAPRGTRVGLICITPENAAGMQRTMLGAGVEHVDFVTAGLDHPEQVRQVFQQAEPIYVSRMALAAQPHAWPAEDRVHEYITDLDVAALRLLRRAITALQAARASALTMHKEDYHAPS